MLPHEFPCFETLHFSMDDGIATVTLNHPERMNTFTAQMRDGLVAVFGMKMQSPLDIRVVSTEARFGFVFARRGSTPEAASSGFFPWWDEPGFE